MKTRVLFFLGLMSLGLGMLLFRPGAAQESPPPPVSADQARLTGGQVKTLIEQLGSDDWATREAATQKLIESGEPALEAVKQALKHTDPEIKLRARFIFKHLRWGISPELRAKIGNLVDSYEESNVGTRTEIIRKLADHGELAVPVLCRLLIYEENPQLYPWFLNTLWLCLNNESTAARAREMLGEPDENTSPWVRLLMGRIAEKEKKFSQAVKHYEAARQDMTDFSLVPSIRKRLVFLYQITKTKGDVLSILDYYLKQNDTLIERPKNPDTPELRDECIILLWFGMNDPAALEAWVEEIDPITNLKTKSKAVAQRRLMLIARLGQSQGNYKQTIKALDLALESGIRNTEVFHYLIDLCLQANKPTKALEVCEQLKKQDPGDIRAYYFSAMAHRKQGDEAAVTECLAKVRELTKDESGGEYKGTHFKLGKFLKEHGQFDWARIEFETVLSKTPHQTIDEANAAEYLAQIAVDEEDYEAALSYTERGRPVVMSNETQLLENFDTFFDETYFPLPQNYKSNYFNSNLEFIKSKTARKKGQTKQGNDHLIKALMINPGNLYALEEMAELAREDKFPKNKLEEFGQKMIKYYENKLAERSLWSVHHCYLANVYLTLEKEPDRALDLIIEALLIDPSVLAYQVTLARVYAKQKRYDEAKAIMKLLINLKPYEKEFKELLDEFANEADKEIKTPEKSNEPNR